MLLSHVERVSDLGIKNDTELKMVLHDFFWLTHCIGLHQLQQPGERQ